MRVWQQSGRAGQGGGFVAPALGLLVVVVAAHGWSLGDGLFFDDHWHRAALRGCGWGFGELRDAATVDLSGRLNHLWWQQERMAWHYARPVAMLVAKLEYALTGGSPVGIHACALAWHWLTALLVYGLAGYANLSRRWRFGAAALFVIMPHSVFTVGWTAARNALVGGFFFAAAALVYASAGGGESTRSRAGTAVRLMLSIALWALALLTRETAIVFPLVAILMDVSLTGWRQLRQRWAFHGLLWALALVFLYWRLHFFAVESAPAIYFSKPTGPEYLPWAGGKLLQLLVSMVFYTPMLMGLATYQGLAPEQVIYVVMAGLVGFVGLWYVLASRGRRGRWLWAIWVIAALLPVVPVFAMPHFGYLPGIPYAIVLAVLAAGVPCSCRPAVPVLMVAATVWSLGVYRVAWWGVIRSEQLVYADILSTTPPPKPGAKVFFINLPLAAIYAPDALREAWGVDDIEGYVLTFAPHPLAMGQPSVVEQVNEREIVVSTSAPGYFSGLPGRMLLDGTRPGSPLSPGTVKHDELFDATVEEADEAGVRKLKFTFHRPLGSEGYYFYVSSAERPAFRLRFDQEPPPWRAEDDELFAAARSTDLPTRIAGRMQVVRLARPVAIQTASPIQDELRPGSDRALELIEQWWRTIDVRRLNHETHEWQRAYAPWLRQRGRYFEIMDIMRRCVRSDLYLTGGHAACTRPATP